MVKNFDIIKFNGLAYNTFLRALKLRRRARRVRIGYKKSLNDARLYSYLKRIGSENLFHILQVVNGA